MSAQGLFDALSTFFDDAPEAVRAEMSIQLVMLAGDGLSHRTIRSRRRRSCSMEKLNSAVPETSSAPPR